MARTSAGVERAAVPPCMFPSRATTWASGCAPCARPATRSRISSSSGRTRLSRRMSRARARSRLSARRCWPGPWPTSPRRSRPWADRLSSWSPSTRCGRPSRGLRTTRETRPRICAPWIGSSRRSPALASSSRTIPAGRMANSGSGASAARRRGGATRTLPSTSKSPRTSLRRARRYLTLRTLKVRDDERPAPLRLVRRRVCVAEFDDYGQPRTTCIVERDTRRREDLEAAAANAEAEALAELDQKALEIIEAHDIKSQGDLRARLRCRRDDVAPLIARLEDAGRITRRGQRDPWRVVPSSPQSSSGHSFPVVLPSPP